MQSQEVRDAQVAVLAAPTGTRHTRPAVGGADRVCAGDEHLVVETRLSELRAGGLHHQASGGRAQDSDQKTQPQRPSHAAVAVFESLAEESSGDGHRSQPQDQDGGSHDREQRRIERSRDVEVAGGAAGCLDIDDGDFEHQHNGRDPAGTDAELPPAGQIGKDPGERERVDGGRNSELRGFQPGGHTGDHARVGPDADDGGNEAREHQETDQG